MAQTTHDRQVIALCLTLEAKDEVIRRSAELLAQRAEADGLACKVCVLPIPGDTARANDVRVLTCGQALGELTQDSRLYLHGHGSWQEQLLGGLPPNAAADLLVAHGFGAAAVISLLGCRLARPVELGGTGSLLESTDSFAARFHARLKTRHGIRTVVHARTGDVAIHDPDQADLYPEFAHAELKPGAKLAWDGVDGQTIPMLHQPSHTKIAYAWVGETQVRSWAY